MQPSSPRAELLRFHPDLRVLTERVAKFDGGRRETYIRVAEMTDEDRKLTQMHALFFAPEIPGARTRDLFQIVATIPSDGSDANDAIGVHVIDIVKSFRFESGPRHLSHDHGTPTTTRTRHPEGVREFWEGFYGDRDRVWSGRPNVVLVDEVTGLTPGTRARPGLRRGCRDAIWFAQQGSLVTATDISQVGARPREGARHRCRRGRPHHVGAAPTSAGRSRPAPSTWSRRTSSTRRSTIPVTPPSGPRRRR